MSEGNVGSVTASADGEGERSGSDESTESNAQPVGTRALDRLEPIVFVAVGGFAGAVLRHAAAVALPGDLPWGTLTVNVAGSFALGILLCGAELTGRVGARTRLVLGTGFLSSFTTYSTFAVETAALEPRLALVNVAANYALGFGAVLVGHTAVRSLVSPEVTR